MGFWPGFGRVGLLVRCLGVWVLGLGCAWAQDAATGGISGVVRDLGGVGVAGATVTVVSVGTGLGREFRSGKKGEFWAAGLGPGRYLVRMEVSGFSAEERLVTVEVGGTTAVEMDVFAGVVRQEVEVRAEDDDGDGAGRAIGTVGAGGDTGSGGVGMAAEAVLTPGELAELPVNGREWQRFELLVPTSSPGTVEDGPVSYRGEPETQNGTAVDGVSGDQSYGAVRLGSGAETGAEVEDESEGEATGASDRPYSAGGASGRHAGAAFVYSQEAVREFRVNAHGYSALYGHAAGGVVTAVTRGGGDAVHGTAFLTVRGGAWAAANPFSVATRFQDGVVTTGVVKPHDLRQQFGGSLGGALWPGRGGERKLFGFYVFDGQRRGFPAISSPGYAGFYQMTATQMAVLARRGVTPGKVTTALNYLDSLSGTVPRRADQTVNFGRLDWQAGGRNRLTIEGNRARWSSPAGSRSGAVVDRGRASLGDSYLRADTGVLAWGWSRGDRMSNDLRVQAVRDLQYEVPQAPLAGEPAISVGGYAPEVAIGPDGFTFGTPAGIGRTAYPDERRYGGAEVWTYARGGHVLQVGGEGSLVEDRIDALNNVEGTFRYDSGVTGGHAGGLVDWVTDYTFGVNSYPNGGCPSITAKVHLFCFRSYSQSFGEASVSFRTGEMAGFAQETWRAGRRLTVGLGVRYEYQLLPFPQRPNGVLDGTFGTVAATGVFPEDRNNVGPRASAAWTPGGKMSVRVGYGVYYGRLAGATVRSALVNTALPSSATHVRITPATETVCPQVANQGFGYPCAYTSAPPAAVETTTSAMAFSRRFRLPAVQQGTVSLEREFGRGFGVSATYLMDIDRQLPNSVDMNIVPSTGTKAFQLQGGTGWRGLRNGETFAVPIYTTRVNPDFGPVTEIESNGDATYNGVTVEVRERGWRGLSVRGSWTYSKALDLAGSSGAVPRTNGQFDPFNVLYDKGVSALNRPEKVVVDGMWRPEVRGGSRSRDRWVRGVANGWQVAGIFRATSGRPYSYNIFGGTYLKGGHESLNGSGGAVYLPTVGRDTLALPMTMGTDLRVSRTVRVREGVRVRGLVEGFNVLNRKNVSGVVQRAFLPGVEVNGVTPLVFQDAAAIAAEGLNAQAFGTATASSGDLGRERQVQVGVRVEF